MLWFGKLAGKTAGEWTWMKSLEMKLREECPFGVGTGETGQEFVHSGSGRVKNKKRNWK